MPNRVAGKVALVTGGARGEGAAHGELLAEEGASVVIVDVLDELGEEHAEALRREGSRNQYRHLVRFGLGAMGRSRVEFAERTLRQAQRPGEQRGGRLHGRRC